MLCRYHSSILYIRRNILTYLSMLLVISMNITSNSTVQEAAEAENGNDLESAHFQNLGVLYRLTIGCQHPLLARLNNDCLYTGFYMFLTTNCCITIFRILLVIKVIRRYAGQYTFPQPDRFWNADHERVYKMLVGIMLFLSATAILAVELYHSLYYEGKSLSQRPYVYVTL